MFADSAEEIRESVIVTVLVSRPDPVLTVFHCPIHGPESVCRVGQKDVWVM